MSQPKREYVTLRDGWFWYVMIMEEGFQDYLSTGLRFWRRTTTKRVAATLNRAYECGTITTKENKTTESLFLFPHGKATDQNHFLITELTDITININSLRICNGTAALNKTSPDLNALTSPFRIEATKGNLLIELHNCIGLVRSGKLEFTSFPDKNQNVGRIINREKKML